MTLKEIIEKEKTERPNGYVSTRQLKSETSQNVQQRALDERIHQKCIANGNEFSPTYEIMHHKCGVATQKVKDREIDR